MTRVLLSLILIFATISGVFVDSGNPATSSETNQEGKLANTALLLIDIQNDYFPGGKMELQGSAEASSCAKKLLSFFREKRMPMVHIQHISVRPGATFFLPGTEGVKIHASVEPIRGENVIQKNYPNSFRDTSLLEYLKKAGITRVVICGMMTHMCVDATTRAAFDHGFECTVVKDACATRALIFGDKVIPAEHVHGAFMSALGAVYARVVNTEDFLSKHHEELPRQSIRERSGHVTIAHGCQSLQLQRIRSTGFRGRLDHPSLARNHSSMILAGHPVHNYTFH